MKHLFIINPHSFGKGSFSHVLEDIDRCFFDNRDDDYNVRISRYPRDAVAIVHNYISNASKDDTVRVYAVGGDGILFDCLNGMVGFPNAELTSVPYGGGGTNDFIRIFGENTDAQFRDLKKLSVAPSRYIDIINCGTNYALLSVNVGLIGKTVYTANKILRKKSSNNVRRHTSNIYNIAGIKAILYSGVLNQHYGIKMDDTDIRSKYANIHIANIACDGGKFVPCPYAMPNDGILDIIFLHPAGKLSTITKIADRNNGHFEKHDIFEYKKCRKISFKSDEPLCVHMDGEAFHAKELNVEIIPNGIKIFVPENLSFENYSYRAYSKKQRGTKQE
jgi:diacylglycerol kinase family enzyme